MGFQIKVAGTFKLGRQPSFSIVLKMFESALSTNESEENFDKINSITINFNTKRKRKGMSFTTATDKIKV